jgi:hypothetical protein
MAAKAAKAYSMPRFIITAVNADEPVVLNNIPQQVTVKIQPRVASAGKLPERSSCSTSYTYEETAINFWIL